jgi:lysophospholipase L1-like esterase
VNRLRRLLPLALALASGLVALVGVDRVAGHLLDVGFTPLTGAARTDTELVQPEFRIHVRTNAAGFRGGPLPGAKAPGTYRVVVLGDSFTWGYGVAEEEAYPAVLARRLAERSQRRVEVVNLGLPGAGPLDYLHHLRHTGAELAPDLVVVGLFANDVNDLYQLRRFGTRSPVFALAERQETPARRPWWRRAAAATTPTLYVLAGRAWRGATATAGEAHAATAAEPPSRGDDPAAIAAWLGARYDRRDAVLARYRALPSRVRAGLDRILAGGPLGQEVEARLALGALVDPEAERDTILLRSPERRAAWRETEDVLAEIIGTARRAGARTVLAVLPAAEQVDRRRWPALVAAGYRMDPAMLTDTTVPDRTAALAARHGAAFADLVGAFRARPDQPLYYILDEHWTAAGHRLAADTLADTIAPLLGGAA